MTTILLTWNPDHDDERGYDVWDRDDRADQVRRTARGRTVDFPWSVGRHKAGVHEGARAFMLRQGRTRRGLVAAGHLLSGPVPDDHWDTDKTGQTGYVTVRWETVLGDEDLLPYDQLQVEPTGHFRQRIQAGGRQLSEETAANVERLWAMHLQGLGRPATTTPDETVEDRAEEGDEKARTHLARERNRALRQRKIDSVRRAGKPIACEVCGFDFSAAFGPKGAGVIDVHHVTPLHATGKTTTALKDLALVCPNCHRMLHTVKPWTTPRKLEALRRRYV